MKDLSIEEKAKRYDEVIEKFDVILNLNTVKESGTIFVDDVRKILTELKESEDERIRKEIIYHIQHCDDTIDEVTEKRMVAWLEKQGKNSMGISEATKQKLEDSLHKALEKETPESLNEFLDEQKPDDKVEPKFKVGDWVILTAGELSTTLQIVKIDTNKKLYWFNDSSYLPIVDEECLHLWTIQDAKDGDVLATKAGGIFIYKELLYDKPFAYCGVDKFGVFKDCNYGDGLDWTPYLSDVTPATKEQRDLLFQKMKEAGYEWNAEKKELKKIEDEEYNGEDYGIDSLFHAQRILEKTLGSVDGYQSDDGILEHKCAIFAVKKLYEQKSAWSEEDEEELKIIYTALEEAGQYDSISWLKSLKERYTWKPSDEQMKALQEAIIEMGKSVSPCSIEEFHEIQSLYCNLKKLKG